MEARQRARDEPLLDPPAQPVEPQARGVEGMQQSGTLLGDSEDNVFMNVCAYIQRTYMCPSRKIIIKLIVNPLKLGSNFGDLTPYSSTTSIGTNGEFGSIASSTTSIFDEDDLVSSPSSTTSILTIGLRFLNERADRLLDENLFDAEIDRDLDRALFADFL